MQRLLTAGTLLAVVVVGFSLALLGSPATVSASTVTLSGYAWSENIGWVHFKGANYGVTVDSGTGTLSGYAWSENIGWVSFVQTDGASCGSGASINIASGAVSGWAKVLSTGECIHLSGANYAVTYSSATSQFSGYAWGDTNVGWLHFAGPGYAVVTDSSLMPAPTAPSNLAATAASQNKINLTWTDNSSTETGFIVERKTGSTGTYAAITTTAANVTAYSDTGLDAGTQYYYRISATNGVTNSAYSNEANATTFAETSTVNVTTSPGGAGWTIYKDGVQVATGVGGGTAQVSPSGTGSVISITGGSVSGYDFPPAYTNTQGGGSSLTLFGGETVGFTLTYAHSFDYTMTNGGAVTVEEGGTDQFGQVVIHETLGQNSGTPQAVDLSASGLPSGVTPAFSTCTPGSKPTCDSTLTLTVAPTTAPGSYTVTITGSPLGRTTSFTLNVNAAAGMFVTCSHTPVSAHVGDTVHWSALVSQNPAHPPYTYLWSGTNVPSGITDSGFDIIYSTTGLKSADVTVRDSKDNISHCSPVGSINIGVSPTFQEF